MQTLNMSMTMSENRARGEITRALNTMMEQMITDYNVGSEADTAMLSFQESISRSMSRANVSGATVRARGADDDGNFWTVVYYSRDAARNEMRNAAAEAARLAPHAAAAFDAMNRMDNAFDRLNEQDWIADS
jgi:hypothetical protein